MVTPNTTLLLTAGEVLLTPKHTRIGKRASKANYRERNLEKIRAQARLYEANNKEKRRAYNAARYLRVAPYKRAQERQRRHKLKLEAYDAYGGRFCRCCGECQFNMLTLDHVNNDGSAHRRLTKERMIFLWAKRNGYPPMFQVLCFNCNQSKYLNGGTCCSHELARKLLIEREEVSGV